MTIKQEIPKGWVTAKSRYVDLRHTSIPHQQIVTDWLWRNKHAEPIIITIIRDKPEYVFRDNCIASYYKRIKKKTLDKPKRI